MLDVFLREARKIERSAREQDEEWLYGYRDRGMQNDCFQFVADNTDLRGRSILDVSCGKGDFRAFLDENSVGYSRYTGIDGSPTLIRQGRKKYGDIHLRCIVWPRFSSYILESLDQKYDVVLSITVVQFHLPYVAEWARKMYEVARKSVVFDWLVGNPAQERNETTKEVIEAVRGVLPAVAEFRYKEALNRCWFLIRKR